MKNIFKHHCLLSKSSEDSGQTSLEYILLLAVVMFMIVNILGRVRQELIAEQNPCPANDTSIGCTIARTVSSFGTTDGSYRYFTLRR